MSDINKQRSQFLKLATATSVAVASLSPMQVIAGKITEDNKMDATEHAVFTKMLTISLPTEGSLLIPPASLPVIPTIEGALLAGMPPHIRQGLNQGIHYFNQGPLKKYGKSFNELPDEQATAFVDEWTSSDKAPHRALAMGLKKLTVLAYWAIPDTWTPLGYVGPVSEKWKLKYRGVTPEPKA